MNQDCAATFKGHRHPPFRVIPVIDLRNGQAVHAVGGRRTHYQPLQSIFHTSYEPISLARAIRSTLGCDTLYVADLDAIEGSTPRIDILREIIALGIHIWIDAGIHDRANVTPLLGLDHSSCTIVAGLETLKGPDALTGIIEHLGPDRVIFSLDLFEGRPRMPAPAAWKTEDTFELARTAIECGANRLLVLDLARVGTNRGPVTCSLIDQLRAEYPFAFLSVGGGISRIDEIAELRDAGANAVLLGSAIHDGRVGVRELERLVSGISKSTQDKMSDHTEIAVEATTKGAVNNAATEITPPGTSARTVLLLAIWIGLIAGYLDAGLLVVNTRLVERGFYRVGSDFAWIIPTGVTVLVLIPAIVIALIARIRSGAIRLGAVVGVLSFVGLLDVCARLPLYFWASLLVSGGLSTQLIRFIGPRRPSFLRLVRATVPLLVGSVVSIFLVTIGGRTWSEYRQRSALPPSPTAAQNVVLIVWDTVRTGSMSLHGYGRPTTPNLERLAGRGTRFDLAFSTSSWTLPAHASLFTGRWPRELGVAWTTPMRDDVPTLAEYLAAHGYETAGFAANLDYCSRQTGVARGFDHYEDFPIDVFDAVVRNIALLHRIDVYSWAFLLDTFLEKLTGHWYDIVPRSKEHAKSAEAVDRSFLRWLGRRAESQRPFFAFLNYNDAHSPYEVPDPSTAGFGLRPKSSQERYTVFQLNSLDKSRLSSHDVRMLIDIYDDSISYLDRRLGLLVNELSRRGVLENTLVIVTSDHGEHLGDHRLFFHGCSLYRQVVQVPLVIVGKAGVPAGRKVADPVSLCDIPATIIDVLGFGREGPFPGQSLARYWNQPDQSAPVSPEPLFMETIKPEVLANQGREPAAKGPMKSLVAGGLHYIQTADGLEELYELGADPEEKFNVAGGSNAKPVLEGLRAALRLTLKRGRRPDRDVKAATE